MQTPPPPPEVVRPDLKVDATTTQLLLKCLEKDPAKRFQMAQDLIASIRPTDGGPETKMMFSTDYADATAGGTGTSVATKLVPPAATPSRTVEAKSSGGKAIGAVAAILIAAIAIGGYFFTRPKARVEGHVSVVPVATPAPVPATETPAKTVERATPAAAKTTVVPPEDRRVKELLGSGRRHIDNGEYAAAIRDLKQALELAPDNAAARAELKRAEMAKKTEEKVLGNH